MARSVRTRSGISFVFQGFKDGWYVLLADVSKASKNLEALAFEGRVVDWLVTQRITLGKWSHFGAGNTGDYPLVPSDTFDGNLALLLKRPADVLRLAEAFPCDLTDDRLLAAIRAESRVHRFIVDDIAKIAHDAIRRLLLTFGEPYPVWDSLGGETRVAFVLQIKHRLDHLDEPVEVTHADWMTQRIKDQWKFGSRFDRARLTDPLLIPWKNLSDMNKARYRLLASVVTSLESLLRD